MVCRFHLPAEPGALNKPQPSSPSQLGTLGDQGEGCFDLGSNPQLSAKRPAGFTRFLIMCWEASHVPGQLLSSIGIRTCPRTSVTCPTALGVPAQPANRHSQG